MSSRDDFPIVVRAAALGYCAGVRRALDLAWQARRYYPDREIFTYGPLIHNEAVLKSLEAAGIQEWDEKSTRIEKLIKAPAIEITGTEISDTTDWKVLRNAAIKFIKTIKGKYVNNDTGLCIEVYNSIKDEILRHDYENLAHIQAIYAIPKIIENSIFIEELPNEDVQKHPNVGTYRYFVSGVKINGINYTVKSVVGIDTNGKDVRYYDQRLTQKEKGDLITALRAMQSAIDSKENALSFSNDIRLVRILQEERLKKSEKVSETGAIIIIRAHGVVPEVVSGLESCGFTVIDATCPRVRRSQEMAAMFAREGRRVIIAGDKDHGEVAGLRGYVRAGERELSEIKKRLKVIKAIIPQAVSLSKGLSIEQVKDMVNNFNANCVINSLGEVTKFSNAAASKILNHKGFDTASIFTHIDELFRTAVFTYEEGQRKGYFRPDGTKHKDHPNFVGYKNFVNKFEVKEAEKKYYIRFTVQEEVPSKKHPDLPHNILHSAFVSDVEKYDMDSPPISVIIKAAVEPPTPYDARLAQFFKHVKPSGVALVGQSTMSGAEYRSAAEKLRAELTGQSLIVADTVCPEAEKRQDAVRDLCGATGEQRVEGVLVVGGKSSANTRRLYELAKMSGADAALIQGTDDIPERFYRMGRVGLSAGASTPDEVVDAVEKALQAGNFHSK